MDLYLVRHAIAHDRDPSRWPDDGERPLTPEGERRFRRAAKGLTRLVPDVELVLSSPFVRAWQTAEILAGQGWPAPEMQPELEPDCPPHKILAALRGRDDAGSLVLVGHRPHLHELASYLLTGEPGLAQPQIKKGGALYIKFGDAPEPGSGTLAWLLTPKVLRGLA